MRFWLRTLILLAILSTGTNLTVFGVNGEATSDQIELHRKGDVLLNVYNDAGDPIKEAKVTYRQTTRDFLFGIGSVAYRPEAVELFREAGINHIEAYVSWEMTMDNGYFTLLNIPAYHGSGFVVNGHCLVWMVGGYPNIASADPHNLPERVKRLSYNELKKELYDHVYSTVNSLKGFVDYWTINEPFWRYADPFHLTSDQWVEICRISADAIRKAHPEGKIIINNLLGDAQYYDYHPLENLRLLRDKGVDYDVIGLEVYGQGRSPDIPLDNDGYPTVSWVSERLDRFSQFGKPIILTEVGVARTSNRRTEWLTNLYTMAFSKQYVRGVVWNYAVDDPFLPTVGMFFGEWWGTPLTPTNTYYGLKNLTASWLTEGSGTTDSEGKLGFRGFSGNYSIRVTAEGYKQLETTTYVQERQKMKLEICMQKTAELATPIMKNQNTNVTSKVEPTYSAPSLSILGIAVEQSNVFIVGILLVSFVALAIVIRKRSHVNRLPIVRVV